MHGSELLSTWRKAHGLSQVELASRLGVSQNTISDWEKRRKSPQITSALRLAEITRDDEGVPAVPVESWAASLPTEAA